MMISMMTSTCRASSADVPGVTGVHQYVGVDAGGRAVAGTGSWFTGAELVGVEDANLAHHRPHVPERLVAARDLVGRETRTDPATWHLMRQVHGAAVAFVTSDIMPGAELRDVDILATDLIDRPLVVLAADCLPILASGRRAIAAAHAGWRGLATDVPGALVAALAALGETPADLSVVIGPAIGPCCYEVGPEVRQVIGDISSSALTRTRAATPSVDLRLAARTRFAALGVTAVVDFGTAGRSTPVCTGCDPGWFSHRREPASGRQAGIIVRRSTS